MSGRAIATSRAISPTPLAPISTIRYRVSASIRSIVIGAPTSLLKDPGGATVAPCSLRMAASRFLVVVLPFEPVMPTILSVPARRTRATTSRGQIRERDDPVGDDDLRQLDVELALDDQQRAPRDRRASGAKRCPSVTSPGIATKTEPGPTSRESVSTDPDTVTPAMRPPRADRRPTRRELGDGEGDHSQPASRRAARASSRAEYGVRTPRMSR